MKLFLLFLLLFAYVTVHQSKPLNNNHVTSDVISEEEIGIGREDESDDVTDRSDDVTADESGEGSGAKKDEIPEMKKKENQPKARTDVKKQTVPDKTEEKSSPVQLRKKRHASKSGQIAKRDEECCHHRKCHDDHHCCGDHHCDEHEHCHGGDEGHHDNDHHHKHDHG